MLQFEVLVLKLVPINGFTTGAITSREVSTLDHELFDDTVEAGPFVAKSLFASGKGTEVLRSLQVVLLDRGPIKGRVHTLGTVLP